MEGELSVEVLLYDVQPLGLARLPLQLLQHDEERLEGVSRGREHNRTRTVPRGGGERITLKEWITISILNIYILFKWKIIFSHGLFENECDHTLHVYNPW